MSFEPASAAIVQLAWERMLGFDDGAMSRAETGALRLSRASEKSDSATFVRLFGSSALVAPPWFLDRAVELPDEELCQHATMLALSADHGGQGLGAADLFFADDLDPVDPGREVTVSLGAWESEQLCAACPPDDVNESGLGEASDVFTIVAGETPLAGSGYREWQGLLAHLSVLVPPEMRHRGLGSIVAGIASHEALGVGLIPQWRASTENKAAQQLALRLGFERCGSQTTVMLTR